MKFAIVAQVMIMEFSALAWKLRKAADPSELDHNGCNHDSSKFCAGPWRENGAYSVDDCDLDGKKDYICDTTGMADADHAGKRWIILSSDCDVFLRAGDAPPCARIKALAIAARQAQVTTQTSAKQPATVAEVVPEEPVDPFLRVKCNSIPNPCYDTDVAFEPEMQCAGPTSKDCSAATCCVKKADCYLAQGANLGTSFCSEDMLFLPSNRCAGDKVASCKAAECCVPKAVCGSIGHHDSCPRGTVFVPKNKCSGIESESCDVNSCCASAKFNQVQGEEMCHHAKSRISCPANHVFAEENRCLYGACDTDTCCTVKEKCSAVRSPCTGTAIFTPLNFCSGIYRPSCTKDVCCAVPLKCSQAQGMCRDGGTFMQENFCSGTHPSSCTEDLCCAKLV